MGNAKGINLQGDDKLEGVDDIKMPIKDLQKKA